MAQMEIGVDSVEPLFLKLIGAYLVHQADSASFLIEIDYGAGTFFLDHLHCAVELLAAVASHRAEDVARGA